MIRRLVLATCFVAIALVAWSRGLEGPYLFDDVTTPLNDPASQSLGAWARHLGTTLRPVTKLTYAIEAQAGWTEKPSSRRVVSLSLHAATAMLFGVLLILLVPGLSATGAAVLAAIWFVHPVHADSVLLISGRTTLLSNFLLLGSLLALATSRQVVAAVAFTLACLSRETALAGLIPLGVLAVSTYAGRRREWARAIVPIVIGGTVALCLIALTPRYRALAEYSMLGRPVARSFIQQVSAVPAGVWLLGNPAALAIDYGIPLATKATQPLFLAGLAMYGAAAAGVVLSFQRHPAVSVGLSLWLAALLPTQSFVPKLDALANRPLCLAFAGALLAGAPFVAAVVGRAPWRAVAAVTSAAVVFTALAIDTSQRATLFLSPLAVWQDAAAKSTVNERPHVNYAIALVQEGRHDEALDELAIAARIDPFSSRIDDMLRVLRSREALK